MQRLVATVAFALLLTSADCLGVAEVGDQTGTAASTQPATTPRTPNATDTPTASSTPTATPPPERAGVLDPDAVTRRHVRSLRAAGTFERHLEINGSATGVVRESAAVDVDRGRVLAERSADLDELNDTHYRDPEGVSSRLAVDDGVDYRYRADPEDTTVRPNRYVDASQVYDFVNATDWERTGTETYGGAEVVRYEARGPHRVSGFDNRSGEFADADVVRAVLLVGTDGAVRLMHVEYREDDWSAYFTTTYRYAGVNATTVTPPEWLESVRDGADGDV